MEDQGIQITVIAVYGMANVFEPAAADGRVVLVGGGFGEVLRGVELGGLQVGQIGPIRAIIDEIRWLFRPIGEPVSAQTRAIHQ